MTELRTDWITNRQVIIAENRADRPNEFFLPIPNDLPNQRTNCPLCPGQEFQTPPTIAEWTDESGRWLVRVVPNKYPAFITDDSLGEDGAAFPFGVQELIIETSRHIRRTAKLSIRELRDVLKIYAERLQHWHSDGRFRYGLIFKNQGPQAGASLMHLHSQLIALPQVPPAVNEELHRAGTSFKQRGTCAYCDLVDRERMAGERMVLDCDGYVAFCPNASLQPYEVWLLPDRHEPWFEHPLRPKETDRLADVLHALLTRIEEALPEVGYNLVLRTAPWKEGPDKTPLAWHHWRIEVLPRVTTFAGLELATGIYINTTAPEHAAAQLRKG